MEQEKDAGVELLEEEHFNMQNPWGKPVVGWRENSQGCGGIHNPMGFAMPRVVLWKMKDGKRVLLYDQPMIIENAGSIVVAEYNGKIAMARNFRMTGERYLPEAASNYIKELQEKKLWRNLIQSLGRWQWEFPRGLAPQRNGNESLEAFIIRTAKLEALEEAGLVVEDAKLVGRVNTNPTFFAHSQYVVYAKVKAIKDANPEDLEIIKGTKLFSMEEIKRLHERQEFDDGLSLAAISSCMLSGINI